MPEDLTAFCRDLYEFCQVIVDQGTGTVERLEQDNAVRSFVLLSTGLEQVVVSNLVKGFGEGSAFITGPPFINRLCGRPRGLPPLPKVRT